MKGDSKNESPYWYRVSEVRPSLREHTQIHRHRYRGEVWYVLEDPTAERFHRFTPEIYDVLQLFNGKNTVAEIIDKADVLLGEDAPDQNELITVLAQLHSADALETQFDPDTDFLLERLARSKRLKLIEKFANPFFLRIPLIDPEGISVWALKYLRPVFSRWGFMLWLTIAAVGISLTALHWGELSSDVLDRVLAEENLILMWFIFPIVKALHEMGHAVMTKAFGGESHEMGVMLLLLMPLPYVDASSASRFRLRRERVLVGAAGMMVEVLLGTFALIIWIYIEPGLIRSIAYNVFFTAGVSTVVFNLNPLLRYDGYYILADLIEIPNLRSKSMSFLLYVVERFLFKVPGRTSPAITTSERNWLAFYGPASLAYRLLVIAMIIWAIATKFFFVGVLVALTTIVTWVGMPIWKGIKYLRTSPRLRPVRGRAVSLSCGFVGALVAVPLWVPFPLNSITDGVVWLPEESIVRSNVEGWFVKSVVGSGEEVSVGDSVLFLQDEILEAKLSVAYSRKEELLASIQGFRSNDVVSMSVLEEDLDGVNKLIRELELDQSDLILRAKTSGLFSLSSGPEHSGRFVARGEAIGTIMDSNSWTVLVLVDQDDVEMIRARPGRVDVRFVDNVDDVYEAEIVSETPTASKQLPSMAFAVSGGGDVTLDPMDPSGEQAYQRWFQLLIDVPLKSGPMRAGSRVYVRFSHGYEPLGMRWGRAIRRLFLSQFGI